MGKGGSSSSSSSNTTNNTNSTLGIEGGNEGLALSNVSGTNITVTDQGAIDSAMELAKETISSQGMVTAQSFDFIRETTQDAYSSINDNLKQSLAFVDTQNQPDGGLTVEIIKPIVYGSALVAMAVIAMRAKG